MIFGTAYFEGDDDKVLQEIQSKSYGRSLFSIFLSARNRYISACQLLRTRTEMSQQLARTTSFDHRALQSVHDRIAAAFRSEHRDSQQLELGEDFLANQKRLDGEWCCFVDLEAQRLAADDEFTRCVISVIIGADPRRFDCVQTRLLEILEERYELASPASRA